MYRQQFHIKVTMGKYREFYDVISSLNDVLKTKGIQPFQIWAPATGAEMNTVVLVTDHASLAAWDEESKKFMGDADVMAKFREMGSYVDGRPRDELWETAAEIA